MYLGDGAVGALVLGWKILGLLGFRVGIEVMQLVPGAGEA